MKHDESKQRQRLTAVLSATCQGSKLAIVLELPQNSKVCNLPLVFILSLPHLLSITVGLDVHKSVPRGAPCALWSTSPSRTVNY